MNVFPWLVVLLIGIPLFELYLLIQVGSAIGALPTVALVVFTAVLGAGLLRQQGLTTVQRIQTAMNRGEVPALEVVEGAILLVGGAMLLTPGFVTDALGFLCLLPPARQALARWLLRRLFRPPGSGRGPRGPSSGRIIEGEFKHSRNEPLDWP